MAKIQDLYDRTTGEAIYPRTSTQAVYDAEGRDLETRLAGEAAKTDVLTKQLAAKQNALTVSADLELTDAGVLSVTDRAKREVFDTMWNNAFLGLSGKRYGGFDPDNAPDKAKPYNGNGLWFSYAEAVDILRHSLLLPSDNFFSLYKCSYYGSQLSRHSMRTYPPLVPTIRNIDIGCIFKYNARLEIFSAEGYETKESRLSVSNASEAFRGCSCLKKCADLDLSPITSALKVNSMFEECYALESVLIYGLSVPISFAWSPKLSLDSVKCMIDNAANTTAITVTVHADVFAKLTGDTTNEASAALTEEELAQWAQVLTDALEKNITFAII